MAQNDTSMPAIGGVSAVKPFASSFKSKRRGKSRRKNVSATSKAACLPPDLDIVSGFAFLSFSTIDELECHIEAHEVNTRSLSINVGEKRKKLAAPKQQKCSNYTMADSSDFVHSKRIKTPSQKILESYTTADLNLNRVGSNVSRELKRTKIRPFPGSKGTDTMSLNLGSSSSHNSSDLKEKYHYVTPTKIDLTTEETNASEISLECSERITLFDEEDKTKQETYPSVVSGMESACSTSVGTEVPEKKKKKKRKRDRSINDQTCQTMFRIKKKKKDFGNNTVSSIKSDEKQNESPSAFLKVEEEKIKESPISSNFLSEKARSSEITGNEFMECEKVRSGSVSTETDTNVIDVESSVPQVQEEIYPSPVPHFQAKGPKSLDLKVHRLKVSHKVEKIDYCARSGGVSLVERHHERQNRDKQDEATEELSYGHQLPSWENDSRGSSSCDVNTAVDNLSENSGNDSSNNSSYGDQESLMSVKNRIFAGSSSVFISSVDESNDTSEIDIELNEADASKPMIDIVKALPKSYLFGHLSSFPDKTTKGTIDVSIQVYENDIQLYMNYAADFKGRIIKIIVPDNEDSKSSCYLKSSYLSGLPKFLQPQEYVKAVRSATERNRRHTIGDLFQCLKNELFGEHVRNYYFSKQAILSKAIEKMEQYEVEGQLLESEKNLLESENHELRSRLNILLFGEDLDDNKLLDLNKVTEHLKTLGIEVEIPPEEPNRDGKISQEAQENQSDDISSKQQKKYVTRKGRPPSEGKLLKSLQTDSYAKLPNLPKPRELSNFVKAAFNNKMKEFVAIAPSDKSETPLDQSTSKEAVKTSSSSEKTRDSIPIPCTTTSNAVQMNTVSDSTVSKIVCNLTKYKIHQQPRSSGTLTIVTNPEPLKGIESKNVVHIKISNDTMKQVGVSSISALSDNSKSSVSPSTNNIDNKQAVGTEQSALCNTKQSQGTAKLTNKVSMSLDVCRNPSMATECKLESLAPENSKNTSVHPPTTKNEVILVPSKKAHQVDDKKPNYKAGEKEEIKESADSTAEESAASSSKDNVPHHSLVDLTKSKEVTMTTEKLVCEGSKTISERGSATTTTYIMAKPQCSSKVSASQTPPQHQSVPAVQKKPTTIKALQGTPLISLAKMQQNQMVLTPRVSVTTADNLSIQNKVAATKQVITTKTNTSQTPNRVAMTAKSTSALPVLKMKQLRAAPLPVAMQQNITLLPMTTTTMATQGTSMLQMTPTTLAKVVTSQGISKLPTVTTNVTMITHSSGMVQMMPSIGNKLVTPQSIAVLPLSTNVTMATHSKPNIQITPSTVTKLVTPIQTTAAQQSITLVPMGSNVKPMIQVPQAIASKVAVASPQGIPGSSSPVTQPTASGYVALVRTPSPNTPQLSQKTLFVPNSSISGTATPFRIVFKPTGKPKVYSTPFPQIKSALQSSSILGLASANTVPMQQSNTSISTSMTTSMMHPSGTLITKPMCQDKVPATNKQVSVQNTGTTNNIPVQSRHLMMKTPLPQPPQTKTLVRVQQATPAPITPSISPVPEQPTKPSTPSTGLVHLSSEVKDFVNNPSTKFGAPVQSTASSVRQLLVSGPVHTQGRLQDPTKPTSGHPVVHTSVAVGDRSMATFNIAVPHSGSLQNSSPRLVSQGNKDKERGLSDAQVSQLTPLTTPVSAGSLGSKETFSEIEKILAKIPSPNLSNITVSTSGNTPGFSAPTSIFRSNVVHQSCSQNLKYSTMAMNQAVIGNTDAAFNNGVRPQQIADTQRSPLSQMITSSTKNQSFTFVSTRDRIPSNQPSCSSNPTEEATRPASVTFSSTCSSTTVTFDIPKPKGDKTCSVVDSPEVVSHMVSADTLSVCNIDSSIPDIASELPSQINPASQGFSSLKPTLKEWPGSKETSLPTNGTNVKKKMGHDFKLPDESTAEDFDLLSTLEWNNNAPNESSATVVSSSGQPYKTGDT